MDPILRNILIGASALLAAVVIFSRSEEQKRADSLLGFTEETGIIGQLGAATNRVSGGFLANVGSAIGEFFSGSFFDRRTLDDLTGTGEVNFVGPPEI